MLSTLSALLLAGLRGEAYTEREGGTPLYVDVMVVVVVWGVEGSVVAQAEVDRPVPVLDRAPDRLHDGTRQDVLDLGVVRSGQIAPSVRPWFLGGGEGGRCRACRGVKGMVYSAVACAGLSNGSSQKKTSGLKGHRGLLPSTLVGGRFFFAENWMK